MTDYIDHCLDSGLPPADEYFGLVESGEVDFPGDPETAVHEAGHAVAAYVLGRPIVSVSSEEWDDASKVERPDGTFYYIGSPGGVINYAKEAWPKDKAERATLMLRDMITAMAGGYAACIYMGGGEPVKWMSFGDFEIVYGNLLGAYVNLTRAEKPPFEVSDDPTGDEEERLFAWCETLEAEVERELWDEVERIIRANWQLVEGLATVLIHDTYLDGAEVYEVFERIEARGAAAA